MLNEFLKQLGANKYVLSRQQIQTLRGQALSGDVDGARKGLERILRRQNGKTKERNRATAV